MWRQDASVIAGVPQATLQTWRTTAQSAYADLMSGAKVVTAAYAQGDGSRSVTYVAADLPRLEAWIGLLNRALGGCRQRRPIRPYFR